MSYSILEKIFCVFFKDSIRGQGEFNQFFFGHSLGGLGGFEGFLDRFWGEFNSNRFIAKSVTAF